MSDSPSSIPETFANDPALADAYRRGWNHGHGLACHNVPELGETYWTEDDGRMTADRDNIREVHTSLCFAAESSSRCYSPFEFTAREFNDAEDGDDGEAALAQDAAERRGLFVEEDEESGLWMYGSAGGMFNGQFMKEHYSEPQYESESEAWITACADNRIDYPSADDLWSAFDEGISAAIFADLATYTDEDYGIEEEEENEEE